MYSAVEEALREALKKFENGVLDCHGVVRHPKMIFVMNEEMFVALCTSPSVTILEDDKNRMCAFHTSEYGCHQLVADDHLPTGHIAVIFLGVKFNNYEDS